MDADSLSLTLSFAGLVLGFISAYGQIKSFVIRALHLSGKTANRILKEGDERVAMFLAYPSALISYVTSRVTIVMFLVFLSMYLPAAFRLGIISAPVWVVSLLSNVTPALAGLLLGALSSVSTDVMSAARKAHRAGAGRT